MARFQMLVTVSLVLLHENKILMLKRSGTGWYDGYYSLPAGCVDGNESVTQALIREAHEEVNINLLPEWLTFACVVHSKMIDCKFVEAIDFFFVSRQWKK